MSQLRIICSIYRSKKKDEMYLYVDKTNTSAQKVYEKLGMENHHYEMYEWMNY